MNRLSTDPHTRSKPTRSRSLDARMLVWGAAVIWGLSAPGCLEPPVCLDVPELKSIKSTWNRPISDIAVLMDRYAADLVKTSLPEGAQAHLASQQPDGSWSDIDYRDRSSAGWKPIVHLDRLQSMAAAHAEESGPLHLAPAVREANRSGLDCWFARAPRSDNWWWNDIGKQQRLGAIGVLQDGVLSPAHRQAIIGSLPEKPSMTGANLTWLASETIARGCLERRTDLVRRGFEAIKGTVLVTTAEGVQSDWSFHQHGPQLYNAGYGEKFLNFTARFAAYARGTEHGFSDDQIGILTSLLLDGDRWMVRFGFMDHSADGREIVRQGESSRLLLPAIGHLTSIAPERVAEIQALQAHIEGLSGCAVSGNRHFFRSDFMTHQRPAFYASVKMCSARTVGSETINGENTRGLWLPYGLTYLIRTGEEYSGIFPVWDWAHLPGVTNPTFVDQPRPNQQTTFVGGVSDGTYGVAAMDLDFASTRARKAYFLFDGELVALGSGITSSHDRPVHTTLNQCLLEGEVTADGRTLPQGEHTLPGASWVHHGGFGYVFPEKTEAHVLRAQQSGSWFDINHTDPKDPVRLDVFTLWLDHGASPADRGYQYIVLPAAFPQEVQRYAEEMPIRVIANQPALQAVRHEAARVTGAVFAAAGKLTNPDGLEL